MKRYRYCHSPAHGCTRRQFLRTMGASLLAGPPLLSASGPRTAPFGQPLVRTFTKNVPGACRICVAKSDVTVNVPETVGVPDLLLQQARIAQARADRDAVRRALRDVVTNRACMGHGGTSSTR